MTGPNGELVEGPIERVAAMVLQLHEAARLPPGGYWWCTDCEPSGRHECPVRAWALLLLEPWASTPGGR